MALLSINADAKTRKGTAKGFLTGILYLAPADFAGIGNLCAFASAGCKAACLFTAGRGAMSSVQKARVAKTLRWSQDRTGFMADLDKDIAALVRKAERDGLTPTVRLNGTSDIPWENVRDENGLNVFERHPTVQFYDYTKNPHRKNLPANYNLTFSLAEDNDESALLALARGFNVAAVFRSLPETFFGRPVINGDESDVRFLDPKGVIVGLMAKGQAKKDTTGFVR